MDGGKEVLLLVDALSREKNVPKETVFAALEMALALLQSREQRVHAVERPLGGALRRRAARGDQVFTHGERGEDLPHLRHEPDTRLCNAVRRPVADRRAVAAGAVACVIPVLATPQLITGLAQGRTGIYSLAWELRHGTLGGYDGLTLDKHISIGGQGQDLRAANTADAPDKVAPRDGKGLGLDGGRLIGALPPLSYHVVRLRKP